MPVSSLWVSSARFGISEPSPPHFHSLCLKVPMGIDWLKQPFISAHLQASLQDSCHQRPGSRSYLRSRRFPTLPCLPRQSTPIRPGSTRSARLSSRVRRSSSWPRPSWLSPSSLSCPSSTKVFIRHILRSWVTPSLAFKGHGIQGSLVKPYVVNQGIWRHCYYIAAKGQQLVKQFPRDPYLPGWVYS